LQGFGAFWLQLFCADYAFSRYEQQMREFEDNLAKDEHTALGALSLPGLCVGFCCKFEAVAPIRTPLPPPQPPFLRLSHTISSPQSADQQANLRAASVLKQQEEAQAAAKSRLVAAITQAKVGKDVQLIEAPHL
jgi:hypothetical protein